MGLVILDTVRPDTEQPLMARDARDLKKINLLWHLARELLLDIARIDDLEHPDARWSVDDLRIALRGTLTDLAAERRRLTDQPLVVP